MKILVALFSVSLFFSNIAHAQEAKPLEITEKPKASHPDGNVCIQGVVRLRVQFLASGEIGEIAPLNSLPYGLIEKAMAAARKIKFQPEIKDGKPTSKIKVVEYAFAYGNSDPESQKDEKAEAIINKAVEKLGGERYLQVKTIVGSGNFSIYREGQAQITQSFLDVIVFPEWKERTEFKTGGTKYIQTNVGETGWIADSGARTIIDQTKDQLAGFKRGIRTSLDNLLRGGWRKENAALTFVGRREASLGRRNNVVKLTYPDDFAVEFEFSDEGWPMKAIHKRTNSEGQEVKEEDRYAQFVETQGIYAPFIIDRFQNGVQTSRVNYTKIEYNRPIPDAIFNKPADAKELRKDLKL
jgi:hypothetical protein